MSSTINFGIDLGTTNSAIAICENGEVRVYKNPTTLKETIASVVAFKGERIIVGEKAKEVLNKNSKNVFGSFKRKMGTAEKFIVPATGKEMSPIELSAIILKELKNFIQDGHPPEATVITIPAAFDTVQSNATKKAGYQAGFTEVVLLQEPIAASLAFANKSTFDVEEGQWLVYDLGGGTFDVALTTINDGEMKISDHEGDNYLGGVDFDRAIIDAYIIPELEKLGQFTNLKSELIKASGLYNKLYHKLLYLTEEAKKELTSAPVAEIEFDIEDDTGKDIEVYLELTRETFEKIISPIVDRTIDMIEAIIDRNALQPTDLKCILLIGGSTYIPLVKRRLTESFNIDINSNIDPTIAVAVGAAYYAGMKPKSAKSSTPSAQLGYTPNPSATQSATAQGYKVAYDRFSKEESGIILIKCPDKADHQYRLRRLDGGYDSGQNKLKPLVSETVPLIGNTNNQFEFIVTDELGNKVFSESINITHGKFTIDGQPLPNNICLELDSLSDETTYLDPIFRKNDILPLKKTITKQVSTTIHKESDEKIMIKVMEGDTDSIPAANKLIGLIEISGHQLERDLIKGSDIELTFEVTESRDIKVATFLVMTDQEFENTFSPSEVNVSKEVLTKELRSFKTNLNLKLKELENNSQYEEASHVLDLVRSIEGLIEDVSKIEDDQTTDEIYVLDTKKRQLGKSIQKIFGSSLLTATVKKYYSKKELAEDALNHERANDRDKEEYDRIIAAEKNVLKGGSITAIKMQTNQLQSLREKILRREPVTPDQIRMAYTFMKFNKFKDDQKAKDLIEKGDLALERDNLIELNNVMNSLYVIMIKDDDNNDLFKSEGTGIQ